MRSPVRFRGAPGIGYDVDDRYTGELIGSVRYREEGYNLRRYLVVRWWEARTPDGKKIVDEYGNAEKFDTRAAAAEALLQAARLPADAGVSPGRPAGGDPRGRSPSMIPTTNYGTWANITTYSLTPEQYVADALGEYVEDYDVEAIVGELLTELQAKLPAGMSVLGNGELIGPAYGPEADAIAALVGEDRSATDYVKELLEGEDGEGGIDLQTIIERHDKETSA